MRRKGHVVVLSSKGQIVIPAGLRRKLGLKAGHSLEVRLQGSREIVLRPGAAAGDELDAMLDRIRRAVERSGRDPLAEFHESRRKERTREARRHERWRS